MHHLWFERLPTGHGCARGYVYAVGRLSYQLHVNECGRHQPFALIAYITVLIL